jgi:periplasmic protein CpxP/Spy
MKHSRVVLAVLALMVCALLVVAPASPAQMANSQMGNSPQAQKLAMMTKQLNLSPEQKMKLMPILEEEAPKVQAIKSNSSLTGMQKMEQLRAIHEQTNPQVQAILSPQQYQQFQQIRQQEIEQAIQKKR